MNSCSGGLTPVVLIISDGVQWCTLSVLDSRILTPTSVNIKAALALWVLSPETGPQCSACSPRSGSGAACWVRGCGTAAARRWVRASGRTGRMARSKKGRAARRSSSRVPSPRAGRRLHTRRTWDRDASKHTHIPHTLHTHQRAHDCPIIGAAVREGRTERRGGEEEWTFYT